MLGDYQDAKFSGATKIRVSGVHHAIRNSHTQFIDD